MLEIGTWSAGKPKEILYSEYERRHRELNTDYVTVFAVHPKKGGGLIIRPTDSVVNDIKSIINSGRRAEVSFWFGTQPKYYTPVRDKILDIQDILCRVNIDPTTIIKELDAEFPTTAPGINQAAWMVSQFKKDFPSNDWRNQFSMTHSWWWHNVTVYLMRELVEYFVTYKPQPYTFFRPEVKPDSANPLMRPGIMPVECIKLFNTKQAHLYANNKQLVIAVANYYQEHPGYELPNGRYDIFRAIDTSINSILKEGVNKISMFSADWPYAKPTKYMKQYEIDAALDYMKSLKQRYNTTESSSYEENNEPLEHLGDSARLVLIQKLLVGLGHDLGSSGLNKDGIDGVAGPRTTAAIKSAERMLQVTEDGIPDDELIERLATMYERVHKISLEALL